MREDIRFDPGFSDPEGRWAISVAQPTASLITIGASPVFIKVGVNPPAEMIGRRIFIHAGGLDLPYKLFSEESKIAAEQHLGMTLKEARSDLPHGEVLCTAKLIGANIINRMSKGVLYPSPKAEDEAKTLGNVSAFKRFDGLVTGPVDKGAWAWWLGEVHPLSEPIPLKGYAGLFDLDGALALRNAEAA